MKKPLTRLLALLGIAFLAITTRYFYPKSKPSQVATSYPECDSTDIIIGNYTLAACNIGANQAGTGEESYGDYYQRGINTPGWEQDGFSKSSQDRGQGPCVTGYHIPNHHERKGLLTTRINENYIHNEEAHHLTGDDEFWDWNNEELAKFQTALKLPLSGVRIKDNGDFFVQGETAAYRASTPSATDDHKAFGFDTDENLVGVGNSTVDRAYATPIRCFKNNK